MVKVLTISLIFNNRSVRIIKMSILISALLITAIALIFAIVQQT